MFLVKSSGTSEEKTFHHHYSCLLTIWDFIIKFFPFLTRKALCNIARIVKEMKTSAGKKEKKIFLNMIYWRCLFISSDKDGKNKSYTFSHIWYWFTLINWERFIITSSLLLLFSLFNAVCAVISFGLYKNMLTTFKSLFILI